MNISSPRVDGSILQLVGDLRAIFNPSLDMETVRQLTNRRGNCATLPPLSSLDSFGNSFLSFAPRLSVQLDGNQSRPISDSWKESSTSSSLATAPPQYGGFKTRPPTLPFPTPSRGHSPPNSRSSSSTGSKRETSSPLRRRRFR